MKSLFGTALKKEGADSPAFLALADAIMGRLTRREQERFKAELAAGAAKVRTAKQEEAELAKGAGMNKADAVSRSAKKT